MFYRVLFFNLATCKYHAFKIRIEILIQEIKDAMHISKPIIKTVEYFDKSNSLAQNSEKANDSYNMKVK